jgi:septum formation protein
MIRPKSSIIGLASRSPRRAELLTMLGVEFEVIDTDIDESALPAEPPIPYVARVALAKAMNAQANSSPDDCILAADTTVSADGEILGKPLDHHAAIAMLSALSGRWHDVHTAVVMLGPGTIANIVVSTRVEFVALDEEMIEAYCASGEPYDKAGGYGIQGLGGAFIRRIEGSYSAVMGLPLCETRELLDAAGIRHSLRRFGPQ